MLWTYFIIFLLGAIPFFEAAAIVPIAIIGGIPTIPVILIAFLGNLFTIVLLILFLDVIIKWRENRKSNNEKNKAKGQKRAKKIMGKYGLPGLSLLGPFFLGSHLTVLLAVGFGGSRLKILILISASIAFWAVLLGSAAHLGIDFFVKDKEDFGFITRLLKD